MNKSLLKCAVGAGILAVVVDFLYEAVTSRLGAFIEWVGDKLGSFGSYIAAIFTAMVDIIGNTLHCLYVLLATLNWTPLFHGWMLIVGGVALFRACRLYSSGEKVYADEKDATAWILAWHPKFMRTVQLFVLSETIWVFTNSRFSVFEWMTSVFVVALIANVLVLHANWRHGQKQDTEARDAFCLALLIALVLCGVWEGIRIQDEKGPYPELSAELTKKYGESLWRNHVVGLTLHPSIRYNEYPRTFTTGDTVGQVAFEYGDSGVVTTLSVPQVKDCSIPFVRTKDVPGYGLCLVTFKVVDKHVILTGPIPEGILEGSSVEIDKAIRAGAEKYIEALLSNPELTVHSGDRQASTNSK